MATRKLPRKTAQKKTQYVVLKDSCDNFLDKFEATTDEAALKAFHALDSNSDVNYDTDDEDTVTVYRLVPIARFKRAGWSPIPL